MLHVRKIRHPTRFTDISGARCKVLTDSAREQIVEVPRCEKPVTQLLCSYIQLNGTNFPFFIFSTSQCPYERQPKKWIISAPLGPPGKIYILKPTFTPKSLWLRPPDQWNEKPFLLNIADDPQNCCCCCFMLLALKFLQLKHSYIFMKTD